jgi:hypothetical protein
MEVLHPAAKRSERSYLRDPAVRWLIDSDLAVQHAASGDRLETELQVLTILSTFSCLELSEAQQLLKRVKAGSHDAHCRAVELLSGALRERHAATSR